METDIRYYRRRACEEMSAASRAVTAAARERRLYLVGIYLERLRALNAPSPFEEDQISGILDSRREARREAWSRPAFAWKETAAQPERV